MRLSFSNLKQSLLMYLLIGLMLLCSGCGGSGSASTEDVPMQKAPEILQQPSSVSVDVGDSIEFKVEASGAGVLRYQWKRDSVDIPGATSAKYSLANIQADDASRKWSVVVSNASGTVQSNEVRLRVKGISLLAGSINGMGSTDGAGLDARFGELDGIAVDRLGNIFVSDYSNHVIRKISSTGRVSTLAGLAGYAGFENGTGISARFFYPSGIAVDQQENVYVLDRSCTVRKIDSNGLVSTYAGKFGVCGSKDGKAEDAQFLWPIDLQSDLLGNLYVLEGAPGQSMQYGDIRKINTAGEVVTLLKSNPSPLFSDRRIYLPHGMAVAPNGGIFVSGNSMIRRIDEDGIVRSFVGGEIGYRDDTGALAQFRTPQGITIARNGDMYVADTFNRLIRKVNALGVVTTFAGEPEMPRVVDGVGNKARFQLPTHVVSDAVGNLFVTDSTSVRKINSEGAVVTIAGSVRLRESADGVGPAASFVDPSGIAIDRFGNTYILDVSTRSLRKISINGEVSTMASNLPIVSDGLPKNIASDVAGNIYIPGQCQVLIVSATGSLSQLKDASGNGVQLCSVEGIAIDANSNVYLSSAAAHLIQKVTVSGVVSVFAGSSGSAGVNDGTGSAARFNEPSGLAVDGKGNIYVADKKNSSIRKISAEGTVSTLLGGGDAAAKIGSPRAITVDQSGNVYVAFGEVPVYPWETPPLPTNQHTILKISTTGVVTTMIGKSAVMGVTLGKLPGGLISPLGLAINADDMLFVTSGGAVLKIQL